MKIYNKPNTDSSPLFAPNTILNATLNSAPMQLQNMYGFAIQLVYTGTIGTGGGTFKLQGSADSVYATPNNSLSAQTPTNWSDIANSSTAILAGGGGGNVMYNVFDAMYNFVRVVYTDASGGTSTAILTVATMNGKGV